MTIRATRGLDKFAPGCLGKARPNLRREALSRNDQKLTRNLQVRPRVPLRRLFAAGPGLHRAVGPALPLGRTGPWASPWPGPGTNRRSSSTSESESDLRFTPVSPGLTPPGPLYVCPGLRAAQPAGVPLPRASRGPGSFGSKPTQGNAPGTVGRPIRASLRAAGRTDRARVRRGARGRRPAPTPRAPEQKQRPAPRAPRVGRGAPPPKWASRVTQQLGRDPPEPGPAQPCPAQLSRIAGCTAHPARAGQSQVPLLPGRCSKFRKGRAVVRLGHYCACLAALASPAYIWNPDQ